MGDKEKADYKKRKLIQESIIKSFVLRKGPEFSLTLNKLETDLTSDMLANGSWKDLKFKDYNFDALGILTNKLGNSNSILINHRCTSIIWFSPPSFESQNRVSTNFLGDGFR